ncbi:MAG TPA: response regulator [Pseudobdellovibrionaceae bacterium]|nr:response regulator [Pseudobdellovibrionaceae bacterium]
MPGSSSKKSILIIDDAIDVLYILATSLRLEGYEVFSAKSGTEALEVLSKNLKLNLIILDMQIGDMSGIDFIEHLEQNFPDIINSVPIVFHSGAQNIPKSKAVGIIQKPMNMKDFFTSVNHFIEIGYHPPFFKLQENHE